MAGGFGSYLNVASAGKIGLLPQELVPKVQVLGNAALSGAAMLLLNETLRAESQRLAESRPHGGPLRQPGVFWSSIPTTCFSSPSRPGAG